MEQVSARQEWTTAITATDHSVLIRQVVEQRLRRSDRMARQAGAVEELRRRAHRGKALTSRVLPKSKQWGRSLGDGFVTSRLVPRPRVVRRM